MNSILISWLRSVSALARSSGRGLCILSLVGLVGFDCSATTKSELERILNSSKLDVETIYWDSVSALSALSTARMHVEQLSDEYFIPSTNFSYKTTLEELDSSELYISHVRDTADSVLTRLDSVDLSFIDESSGLCTNCDAKLTSILSVVESNSSKLDSIGTNQSQIVSKLDDISTKIDQLDYAINAVSNLVEDLYDGVGGGDSSGGGSGGSGCGCESILRQILSVLEEIRDDVSDIKIDVHKYADGLQIYVNWFNAIKDDVTQYYKLLNERYNHWDGRLTQNLQNLYRETQDKIEIVTDRLRYQNWSMSQALSIALDEGADSTLGPIKLSNEGYIGLQSLILQERQYLTQLDIASALRSLTNGIFSTGMSTNDLWWAMRYYMDYNDNFHFGPVFTTNPFKPDAYYNAVTNFFIPRPVASSFASQMAYNTFVSKETNWFNRVELYLMNMNGVLLPGDSTKDIEDAASESEISSAVDAATNGWNSVFGSIGSSTNKLSEVVNSFTEFLSAFHLESNNSGEYIVIIPDTDLFGIVWQGVSLSPSVADTIVEPVGDIFKYLWYIAFALFGFKVFMKFLYICGKLVGQTVFIVSQFMGGS